MCDWHYFAVQVGVSVPAYFRIKFMAADEYNKKYKIKIIQDENKKQQPTINIKNSQFQINYGDENTQNIKKINKATNININFVIELISISIISLSLIPVALHFFFFKKKIRKSKTKKKK